MTIRSALRPAALLAALLLALPVLAGEKLPSDERIKTGQLKNGLTWKYFQHANPPGRMALLVHVGSGSLNETDAQRGVAHFLEHMAFNGTEHFKPGELIPFFERIGMEFGPDLNAFTSFDQTAYMLFLPDVKPETIEQGLKVLSDYVFRQLLLDEEIDQERGVILSELRSGMSAQQRLRDQLFERLFAGTRVGRRLPIGVAEVIEKAPRSEFEDYYRTWYRPERMTLILVGDSAPEPLLPLVEQWFGTYEPPRPARPEQGPELQPFTQERAFVFSDPEYADGDVDLYDVRPARPPTTTVEQARVDLVEQIGSWIIGRRYADRVKKGEAAYRTASASVSSFLRGGMLVNASATGEPKDWEKMLDELVRELTRARAHGFTARELELAKKELTAGAERAVRTESTRNARGVLMQLTGDVNDGEPTLSAQQNLDLLNRLLPSITLAEVNRAFAENFKPGTFAFVVTLPAQEGVKLPTEDEVLAAARAAQARTAEPPAEETRATELLEELPKPGSVTEQTTDEALGITSAWLSNGVRVHHRFMDYKKDTVLVSIALAGGEIEETAENAGISQVATLAFAQPATGRLKSTDVEDILTGKNIRVGADARGDAFTVTISGSPRDLETGLQLAYALLTDGRIETSAFDKWKQGALQQYAMASRMPQFIAIKTLRELLSGNDPRRTVLDPAKINAQDVARAQAWLERIRDNAPIEATIVGDLPRDEALALLARYVGALRPRPRSADHLAPLRQTRRGAAPLERRVTVDTVTPQTMAVAGFVGTDAQNVTDVRALDLAANVLDSRLIKRIREELGLVYSISAGNAPSPAYRDSGLFYSGAPCAPDKGDEVVAEIHAAFKAFATDGPTAEELANAKKQYANNLDTDMKEPRWWFERLQYFDLRGFKLADLRNVPEAYEAFTAEQVRDVFRKYYVPERMFHVVATPPAAVTTAPAEK